MNPQTEGALALCPTGNAHGSFYFMSILTGWVLNRLHAMPLPVPDEVVDRIHQLARQQKAHPGLLFGVRNERIPSTTPGAEPPRDARDSGSARSHSTHLETSSSDRP